MKEVGVPAWTVFHCGMTLCLSGMDFRSNFKSTCLVLPQEARLTFPSSPGTQIWVSMRAVGSKLLLNTRRFLFPKLAVVEELNFSNARRRGTGDDEGRSLKQCILLSAFCSFSPVFFKAAVYVDVKNPVDVKMLVLRLLMTLYLKTLILLFSETGGDGKNLGYVPSGLDALCRTHAFMLWLASQLCKPVGTLKESRGISLLPNAVLFPAASPCIPQQQNFRSLQNSGW